MALFPHLLQPVLWERTGNIPPLVRLLQAYLERGASTIASAAADKIVSPGQSPALQAWSSGVTHCEQLQQAAGFGQHLLLTYKD